jgi:hypothetical protein
MPSFLLRLADAETFIPDESRRSTSHQLEFPALSQIIKGAKSERA